MVNSKQLMGPALGYRCEIPAIHSQREIPSILCHKNKEIPLKSEISSNDVKIITQYE